ncbi:MAG: porin family protein [Terricaulis sp.]
MKKLVISVIAMAAAMGMSATAAHAEWYAGASYTNYDFDNAEVGGVTGRLGYKFHPNFAVEAEGTAGVDDDDNAELDHAAGIYGVGILPVSSNFDVFGRVGYQEVEIDGSGPVADISDDGVGYGVGANYRFANGLGLRGEYTRLDGDVEADTFSLGGVVNF